MEAKELIGFIWFACKQDFFVSIEKVVSQLQGIPVFNDFSIPKKVILILFIINIEVSQF